MYLSIYSGVCVCVCVYYDTIYIYTYIFFYSEDNSNPVKNYDDRKLEVKK